MINIRPVSDLRNKFTDIEAAVNGGEPVFLTKNGCGSMVVMSIEAYSRMKQNVEQALNEARIQEIENILKHAHIVDIIYVKVKYLDLGKEVDYEICGSESDPFHNKISNDSPLAKAIMNHKKGDKFIMTTESGKDVRLELVSIK